MFQIEPDTMDNDEKGKIFVGGLSWETTHANLMQYFARFGEVVDCVVMKNAETGRSRGFGFVTFAEPSVVHTVLMNGPHTLDGRTIDPKPCNPRTLQKPKKGSGFPKVFLGGLNSNVTETDLRNFFTQYGRVMEVVIMYDQEKKKSRGFGFLSFESEDAVNRCVADHFVNLNGKNVEIKRAEPRNNSEVAAQLGMLAAAAAGGGSMAGSHSGWTGVVPSYQSGYSGGGMQYQTAASNQSWDTGSNAVSWSAQPSTYAMSAPAAAHYGYATGNGTADNASGSWSANNNNSDCWSQDAVNTTPINSADTAYLAAAGDMSTMPPPTTASSSGATKQQTASGGSSSAPYSAVDYEYAGDYQGASGDNYVVGPLRVIGMNNTYHPYRRS